MKYIRKFNEEYKEKSIEDWCKELKLKDYTIIDDGSVDINSDVDISYKELKKIPLQFNIVNGSFSCDHNDLITLKGSPTKISGNFWCNTNKLSSIKYCTQIINGLFSCIDNFITSLEYGPKEVADLFACDNNLLITLKGSPEKVYSGFLCASNNLISLEGAPKEIYNGYFDCENNKLTNLIGGPEKVYGDYYCNNNNLISLEGGPIEIGGELLCNYNPIYRLYNLFKNNYKLYKDSLDYNYLIGTNIIKLRFQEACEEADVDIPNYILGYNYI